MQLHIQSVSEITRSIRNLLEGEFRFVHINGEISNLKCPVLRSSLLCLERQ